MLPLEASHHSERLKKRVTRFTQIGLIMAALLLGKDVQKVVAQTDTTLQKPQAQTTETEFRNPLYEIFGDQLIDGTQLELKNKVFITIDNSNSPKMLKRMVEKLESEGVTAVMFPNVGNMSINNPDEQALYKKMYRDGFQFGYQPSEHQDPKDPKMTFGKLDDDFSYTLKIMRKVLDDPNFHFEVARAPLGHFDARPWMQLTHYRQLVNIKWNVYPRADNTQKYFNRSFPELSEEGKIVLLHILSADETWINTYLGQIVDRKGRDSIITFDQLIAHH